MRADAPRSADRPVHLIEQATIPAQTFRMGDTLGDGRWGDGETPVHAVSITAFDIDTTSVTNDDFARFVRATGYRTEAEVFGYSAVFHLALDADDDDVLGQPPSTPWWLGVRGADWRHPGGPRSSVVGIGDHPVVHVSWNDAVAYCDWAGRTLPTEAQWEAASRGGLDGARYPWGDDLGAHDGDGRDWRVNIFQGRFPTSNTLDDGYLTTAPVRSFTPNGYGLWQTVGNVWEWCSDVFDDGTYSRDAQLGTVQDPAGPGPGPAADGRDRPRVMRGGSYLCHDSYCNRYRNAARSQNTPDSSTGNAGFRTVSRRAE
nr:formylglycine-generating enzyme family protein [Curtobacterium sp. VKM Ac-1376]